MESDSPIENPVSENGDEKLNLLKRGHEFFNHKKYEEAKSCFLSVLNEDSNNVSALYWSGRTEYDLGNFNEALNFYQKSIAVDPTLSHSYTAIGLVFFVNNDFDSAIKYFKQALNYNKRCVDSHHYLGRIYSDRKIDFQSKFHFKKALELAPNSPDIHNNIGKMYAQQNIIEDAAYHFKRALAIDPNSPESNNNLASCYHLLGEFYKAETHFRKAIELKPDYLDAKFNLAKLLGTLNKKDEAINCFENVIKQEPRAYLAKNFLALLLNGRGDSNEAIKTLKESLEICPDHIDTYLILGGTLASLKQYNEAMSIYDKALKIQPENSRLHCEIGRTFFAMDQLDESELYYKQSLYLDSTNPHAHAGLGQTLSKRGQYHDALKCFETGNATINQSGLKILIAILTPVLPASHEEIIQFRKRVNDKLEELSNLELKIENPANEIGATNFYLAYHGLDDLPLQKKIADTYLRSCDKLKYVAPHCQEYVPKKGKERIKVGLISDHFHMHTIGKLYSGIIENLSKDKFEIIIIRSSNETDQMGENINSFAEQVICFNKYGEGLYDAQENIAKLELDILFYADIGMDPFTYYLAFSRLAPIQCVSWGHPDSTGIPTIDYFISSKLLETENSHKHYSEKLVKLSCLPTYYYAPDKPDKFELNLKDNYSDDVKLYVCPQTLFKFHPDFDDVIAKILDKDKYGKLLLINAHVRDWNDLLLKRISKKYPEIIGRIEYLPQMRREHYLELLMSADAVLDPLHFSGGNSSLEAFSLDVPIVTWPGDFMRGRVTYACYKMMKIQSLIAKDHDDYVNLAYKLANDKKWKKQISDKINDSKHVLFENQKIIDDYELFFTKAVAALSNQSTKNK